MAQEMSRQRGNPGQKSSTMFWYWKELFHTSIGMLSQEAVFASDHISFFMDLDAMSYFGHEPDVMPAKQLRQLQMDDPKIAEENRQHLHRLFTGHNMYRRVKIITERSKTGDW
jgi:hypothetical protein